MLGLTPAPADIDTPTKAKAYLRQAIDNSPSTAKRLFGENENQDDDPDTDANTNQSPADPFENLSTEMQQAIAALLAAERNRARQHPSTDHA